MSAFHILRSSVADRACAVEVAFDPGTEPNQQVSVVDETADVVAEKLCVWIGLC